MVLVTPVVGGQLGHLGDHDALHAAFNAASVNAANYAEGDGVTDDYAALQEALDESESVGGFFLPEGTWLTSQPLSVPSGIRFSGQGRRSILKGSMTSGPVVASAGYLDASESVRGRSVFSDFQVQGPGSSVGTTSNHGLVVRDFYTTVSNVGIRACGGDGLRFTHLDRNDANGVASSLVNNRICGLMVEDCNGVPLFYGTTGNLKLTDAYLSDLWLDANAGAEESLFVGSGAGTTIKNVHIYGDTLSYGIRLVGGFSTDIQGVYVERFLTNGIRLESCQTSVSVDGVHITAESDVDSGAIGVRVSRNGSFANCVVHVSNVTLRQLSSNAVTVVDYASSQIRGSISGVRATGTGIGAVTLVNNATAGIAPFVDRYSFQESSTASTPGTVVRKIEVYNSAGASIGFLPVYDAIT